MSSSRSFGWGHEGWGWHPIIGVDPGIELLFELPFDGLEQLDVKGVAGQLPAELDEGVAGGHRVDQGGVGGQGGGVRHHVHELGPTGLRHPGEVEIAFSQSSRLMFIGIKNQYIQVQSTESQSQTI